jgi:hypothetical protein
LITWNFAVTQSGKFPHIVAPFLLIAKEAHADKKAHAESACAACCGIAEIQ